MQFRKKPVVIEATQWNKPGDHPAVKMCYFSEEGHVRWAPGFPPEMDIYGCQERPAVRTLEGWHEVTAGDWIITGIIGEHYSCKPDIFEATYEAV